MRAKKILEETLTKAKKETMKECNIAFSKVITEKTCFMVSYIDSNKSLISALVTIFVKKIIEPKQDIRLHRTDFFKGYSARTLDTKYITPFFKVNFPKYANKESAFLTLATREKIKWTKGGRELKN